MAKSLLTAPNEISGYIGIYRGNEIRNGRRIAIRFPMGFR